MKEIYSYIDDNDEFVDINFVENVDNIEISKMKIVLINSIFTINYKINREILVNLLNNEHITYKYEPSSHAAVNIKYKCNNRIVSILVFQTGNIIITGAKKISQIIESYRYIHTYLQKNKTKIIKKDINTLLSKEDYNKIIMKNNNTDDLDDEDNNDDNDVKLINNL
jgi:TATA-box binding protein (TBP) (component of TFIID and TFIIIB)